MHSNKDAFVILLVEDIKSSECKCGKNTDSVNSE